MVLLRIRVYPEPFAQESCATNGRSFLVIVPRPGYRLDNASIFFLTPIAHLSILFIYQNGLARKNHEQALRHPPPFHCFARPLAGGGGICARFSRAPNKRVGRFDAPEYIQPLLIQGVCPPGSDEDVPSFKSKAPPPDPGTHLAASTSPPVPPLTQGRLCSLIPECPRPSWRGLLPFPLPPPSP